MKITKTSSGKRKVTLSKSEWTNIGKTAGWMSEDQDMQDIPEPHNSEILSSVAEKYLDYFNMDKLLDTYRGNIITEDIYREIYIQFPKETNPDLYEKYEMPTGEESPLGILASRIASRVESKKAFNEKFDYPKEQLDNLWPTRKLP